MYGSTRKNKTVWSLRTQDGFIALISAILISVSLLILVVAVGFGGFFGRFAVLDSEVKEVSNYLAEACVNFAIIELAQDEDYAGGETRSVGGEECEVVDVRNDGSGHEIDAQGVFNDAFTNLRVTVNSDEEITEWLELPVFP